ncbi:MAG: YbaB/EbfC family nucleoid-associated protein [Clostridiales bacterium]|jgi:DNA-binding protein YbaB|nr:YbaB/EbfC family nucleoid-associated protein [Clostridiales bacterium]
MAAFFKDKVSEAMKSSETMEVPGVGSMPMKDIVSKASEMQVRIKEVQDELMSRSFEGSTGGGSLIIVLNGKKEVLSITIVDKELLNNDNKLTSMIVSLINEIVSRIDTTTAEAINGVATEMGMPGLFNTQLNQ